MTVPKLSLTRLRDRLVAERIYPLLAIVLVFSAAFAPDFATTANLRALLDLCATDALVVAGLSVVLITGEIDLTVGAVLGLAGMFAIGWESALGLPGSIAVALAIGGGIGLINGFLVGRLRLNSITVTLAGLIAIGGISLSFKNGQTVSGPNINASLWIQHPIWQVLTPAIIITLALVGVLQLLMSQTTFGRTFYLIGGSENRGRLAGISSTRYIVSAFVLSGVMAALGGVVLSLGLDTGSPFFGQNEDLTVIAAAVVGGTSLFGAEGSIAKSVLGVLLLDAVANALDLVSAPSYVQPIAYGAILLAVFFIDGYWGARRRLLWLARPRSSQNLAGGALGRLTESDVPVEIGTS